jgi:hypothetical protein
MPDDMPNQIDALELLLADATLDATTRAVFEARLHTLRSTPPQPAQVQTSGINLAGAQIKSGDSFAGEDVIKGDKVLRDKVLGDKIVQQFFNGQSVVDGERLLRSYLVELAETQRDLRLGRMTRSKRGSGESLLPALELDDVFTALFTDGPPIRLHKRVRPKARALALAQRRARRDHCLMPCRLSRCANSGSLRRTPGARLAAIHSLRS